MLAKLFRRVTDGIAAARVFSGPPGRRLYAVGDVHGRLDLLDRMLNQITVDIDQQPVAAISTVFLGDLIDRGNDSAGVISRLSSLDRFPGNVAFLMGNHEEVLLRVLRAESGVAYDWLEFGGDAFVASYGGDPVAFRAMSEAGIAGELAKLMPADHIAFVRDFHDSISFGDFLLVHAGVRPGIPLDRQSVEDLRWIRKPFLNDDRDHGYFVIHGHTISDGIDRRINRLGVDTGAYRTGILTAAAIEGDDVRFLATGD